MPLCYRLGQRGPFHETQPRKVMNNKMPENRDFAAIRPRNFALMGAAGYIAPRHMEAIVNTGNRLVAATDPHDAVGVLDRYSFDVRFFREIERFDRHLEKLCRGPEEDRVHWVSICTPNYLHDAHVRMALRVGADAICEKPLVISPWNLDALQDIEEETGGRVATLLQLRVHPALLALRARIEAEPDRRHEVDLTYLTSRGPWYQVSWKGSKDHSGGVATNIGIHFFDLLLWLFGSVVKSEVHLNSSNRVAGFLELERADVRWFLSSDRRDLPFEPQPGKMTTFRSISVDGEEVEFTGGFTDLHTLVYEQTLAGGGFGLEDARPSIELAYQISTASGVPNPELQHRLVEPIGAKKP
jgi:UDP-N-acetyl-2-amino-2-deoxyglucuronate dehydrogenase